MAFVCALAGVATAVETRFWQQGEYADFEKGNLTKISVRSDGRIFLAPALKEVLDASVPYLWAVAQDSKGNIYAGGGSPTGSTAKLFVIDAAGKSKVLAELDGLEIHAIAVDRRDRVYAATAPDGKVYRIVNDKPEIFYEPHAKYIWALAFSSKGDLYVATGDRGDVHKVAPDGKGSVFFKTEETHARSLAIDQNDNLIVGTEPGGTVVRITPVGEGFVLYQTPKREVTAVAVASDGSIYAAGVGAKPSPAPFTPPATQPAPQTPAPATPGAPNAPTAGGGRGPAIPPPTFAPAATSITGGSEVYRIYPDGSPRKVWSHSQDIAYALAFDSQGRPVVGTGNKGGVYRLDSDLRYTLLLNLAPTQVTAFGTGRKGELFAATGNIGKVYRIGPESEKQGAYESETFDAGAFTYWGRLSYIGDLAGGAITFEARSGNVNHPQKNWSAWSPVTLMGDGGRITSPAARFVQFRATFNAAADGRSPWIGGVDVAYLPKNLAPVVLDVEVTPTNYRFTAPLTPPLSTSSSAATITLPPLGGRRPSSTPSTIEVGSSQSMSYAKGHLGVRWAASDENGDTLIYKVEIRGVQETQWKLLKDKVREKYMSFDTTAFPDGRYVVRVTASDAPSNPPDQALSSLLEGDPFLVDNTPPQLIGLTAAATGNRIEVRWRAKDASSIIDKAEYSVNGGDWMVVEPTTRLSDSPELEYRLTVDRAAPGECTIAVRVTDEYENQTVEKTVVR